MDGYVWNQILAISQFEYQGYVYNFDVAIDHSYVVHNLATHNCHVVYNFGVNPYQNPINGKKGKLNCHLFQRSWDVFLGWNTTTAALLTYLIAHHLKLRRRSYEQNFLHYYFYTIRQW